MRPLVSVAGAVTLVVLGCAKPAERWPGAKSEIEKSLAKIENKLTRRLFNGKTTEGWAGEGLFWVKNGTLVVAGYRTTSAITSKKEWQAADWDNMLWAFDFAYEGYGYPALEILSTDADGNQHTTECGLLGPGRIKGEQRVTRWTHVVGRTETESSKRFFCLEFHFETGGKGSLRHELPVAVKRRIRFSAKPHGNRAKWDGTPKTVGGWLNAGGRLLLRNIQSN
ncbi:MAG: hypothetical protein KatS3mg105_0393 [Gemmatales bacterium]|nr:MAG: hypothetical protein KatS3mg105_0393 [Gemmatales bacterium]